MKTTNTKSLIIISLLVIFSLSATYAFLNLDASDNSATGEGGCFVVDYTAEQSIGTQSLVSTPEEPTTAITEVVLNKNENCEIYTEAEIKINTNDSTTAPIDAKDANGNFIGALKYKVIKKSGNGTMISEGSGSITAIGETTLATVNLTEDATTYEIYLWIDSTLSTGTYNAETYSGYLYAESNQSSTIRE